MKKQVLAFLAVVFASFFVQNTAWSGQASLTWDAPINADGTLFTGVASYKVYMGSASGAYSAPVDVGNVLSHTLTGLTDGATYYFATTTVDTTGAESAFSNEVAFTVPVPVVYYTITASAGAGGSISPAGAISVASGGSKSFTVTPAAGYNISDLKVDGVSMGAAASYTFNNIIANHTIQASFVAQVVYYSITASAGSGGSISPSGTITVASGGAQMFTITPALGYKIADVKVDGVSVGAVSSYSFSGVSANHTIQASFASLVASFTITSSTGSNGGSISPSGSISVASGGSVTYTMKANKKFVVNYVLVDGVSIGAVSSYTFSAVSANHTIQVFFKRR